MAKEKNEDGKNWTEIFKSNDNLAKKPNASKVDYPNITLDDLSYDADYETGLFI